ncbi:MAG: hypothetical protein V2A74_10830 [bacterium]
MFIIIKSREISLPARIARKLKGKRVKIQETPEGVLLRTEDDSIGRGRGILKKTAVSTKDFLRRKREDLELEG